MSLTERDQQSIWHPYTPANARPPIAIVRGEGVHLFDESGKKYIDAVSSWWVNIHGHSNPYIAGKVSEQLRTLEHVIFAGFTHQPAVDLAERLLAILPGSQSKVFYSDNGSTAVEVALKMAIQYWNNLGSPKRKIISFEHAYHGDTFGAMSVSARSAFTGAFSTMLFDVVTVPFPKKGFEQNTVSALKEIIGSQQNDIAAFIFEPLILGAGGMLMYEAGVLDQLLALCKAANIVAIADEVMTGFGRTGKLFACEHLQQAPDIICLSKGITGGTMPFGVTTCNKAIHDAFTLPGQDKTLFHGHSYTANPLACTASLASLDLLLSGECRESIARICGRQLRFATKLQQSPQLENVRCTGTILAFDVRTGEGTSYFNSRRDELYAFFLNEGVILRPLGNTLYILPPYCIGDQELDTVYSAIEKCFGM